MGLERRFYVGDRNEFTKTGRIHEFPFPKTCGPHKLITQL